MEGDQLNFEKHSIRNTLSPKSLQRQLKNNSQTTSPPNHSLPPGYQHQLKAIPRMEVSEAGRYLSERKRPKALRNDPLDERQKCWQSPGGGVGASSVSDENESGTGEAELI